MSCSLRKPLGHGSFSSLVSSADGREIGCGRGGERKLVNSMVCDINPDHGEMKEEPMYGTGMQIVQFGWFCQVSGCDGYGGPVEKRHVRVSQKTTSELEQLALL